MKKRVKNFTFSILIVSLLFALVGCTKKDKVNIINNEKLEKIKLPKSKKGYVYLNLYFDSNKEDGTDVVKEERLINKEELIGEDIVQELIKGPTTKSELTPIFPQGTRLLSFSIKDNIAYVSLSKEVKLDMNESKEKSCVKALVYSLTELKSINKVKILIENKSQDTLSGNANIRKPLGREDFNEK